VDSGQTATYTYDALNRRVRSAANGTTTEYVFNAGGQRVSEWNATTRAQLKGKYYWGSKPVAYYSGGATHFEHQDWLGTERMRTTYNGGVEGSYSSLPWGDGQSSTGADTDAAHYAQLDHDTEANTDHADYRQYSNAQGRWLSPDPYDGSYNGSNPQSMNRYVYAMNNPLSYVDPSGLNVCVPDTDDGAQGYETNGTSCRAGYHLIVVQVTVSVNSDTGQVNWYDASLNWGAPLKQFRPSCGNGINCAPSNYPGSSYTSLFCVGDALKANGLSIGFDIVGAIPGLGNLVSGTATVARVVDAVASYGGSAYGLYAGATDKTPGPSTLVGVTSASVGLSLSLADVTMQGAVKSIPVYGNIVSGLTGVYDIVDAAGKYQDCMKSGKYN
jgi:RHS repeat-associated protein